MEEIKDGFGEQTHLFGNSEGNGADGEFNSSDEDIIIIEDNETGLIVPEDDNGDTEVKYITIKARENVVEGSWAELPIFSFNRPKFYLDYIKNDTKLTEAEKESRIKEQRSYGAIVLNENNSTNPYVKEYKWQAKDNGSKDMVSRALRIVGSAQFGLLQFSDFEILMATSKAHYTLQGKNKIAVIDNKYLFPKELEFTYSEVARHMGYESLGGSELKRLDIAYQRMKEVTIYNKVEGGLYDVENKRHISDPKTAYSIIDTYQSYSYVDLKTKGKKRDNYREIRCKIKLNDFFHESMCKSYFKLFDHQLFLDIKQSVAKKIYLMTHKWRGTSKPKRWFIIYEMLYDKIPLDDTLPTYRKKDYVTRACKELIELGYFEDVRFHKTHIEFIFTNGTEKLGNNLDKYNNMYEIKRALVNDYEFTEEEVSSYINLEKLNIEYIQYLSALMRYCDNKVASKSAKHKKEYVEGGLRGKYNIPSQFYK